MPFPAYTRLSPNFAAAPAHEQRGVLIHHSGLSFAATIERILDPASEVSYHCIIAPDGTRCTLVEDEHIAWHAGASTFLGRSSCNDFLLGVSFAGNTYEKPLTSDQMQSAVEWLANRWAKRGWSIQCIIDHRGVSPGRKDDLNPVEWLRFLAHVSARFSTELPH